MVHRAFYRSRSTRALPAVDGNSKRKALWQVWDERGHRRQLNGYSMVWVGKAVGKSSLKLSGLLNRRLTLASAPVAKKTSRILTWILCDEASSLELLNGNFGAFREQEDIPVLVPHG